MLVGSPPRYSLTTRGERLGSFGALPSPTSLHGDSAMAVFLQLLLHHSFEPIRRTGRYPDINYQGGQVDEKGLPPVCRTSGAGAVMRDEGPKFALVPKPTSLHECKGAGPIPMRTASVYPTF